MAFSDDEQPDGGEGEGDGEADETAVVAVPVVAVPVGQAKAKLSKGQEEEQGRRIADERAKAKKNAQADLIKRLGFDTEEAILAKLQEVQAQEDAKKSETERLTTGRMRDKEKITKVEQERDDALARVRNSLVLGEVKLQAQQKGFHDWRDVVDLIRYDDLTIDMDTGEVGGVEEQLDALGAKKPYLVKAVELIIASSAPLTPPAPPKPFVEPTPKPSSDQVIKEAEKDMMERLSAAQTRSLW